MSLTQMIGMAIAYLLSVIFDLKIAKYFTLASPANPLDIVIQNYGAEYDAAGNSYLDLFIATNKLTANQIMLVPAGTQVVVYS